KRLLWRNIKYSFLKFFDEKLFSTESNDLFRVDVTSGLALWNKSFEKKIAQPIGVYKNQLNLSLKDQILIGLDVETGDLLWEAQIPKEIRVDISRNAHLDLQADKIYFLTSIAFMEFDIQTAKVSRTKSFWTGDFQTSWQFGHSCKQDDYLYFTAGIGTAQFYYWLGVFHIPTMEIVWKYQREDRKETFNSTPQVNGNKLFALDSGGTLHIFERD
ncbi:MAG TPA: PQQ-binding-like beta-propeller repeat protein, partial [Emticicia sp.]